MKLPVLSSVAVMVGVLSLWLAGAGGQTTPPTTMFAPSPAGPQAPVELAPPVRDILQILHDRKTTLKDFIAKIDYSVEDKTGDVTGKRGIVDFLEDPVKGAMFSADFTVNTADGKPKLSYHTQFIFDGRELTIKDFGASNNVKQFVRTNMLPPGAKPGDAVTLNGALPLPIGIDVDEVARNFEASLLPTKETDRAVLKLVPRTKGKFDYSELQVTVDTRKDMQLPVKMVTTSPGGDSVTTIVMDDLKVNTGNAKMLDSGTPASEGWTERGGGSSTPAK